MKKIPEGYKETELGVIPQEWEVSKLGDIGSFRKGKGIKKDEVIEKGLPCLRYGEIYTSYDYKFNKTKSFISEETAESSIHIQKGNIVFAGSGETVEDIGKAIVYLGDVDCYVGGDTIIMKPNKYIDGLYLSYFFGLSLVTKQKRKLGQGNAIVHIYLEGIKKIIVTYPPLPEQQKIAEILSSVDEHIEKLDETISEYELLKKGMMKKLLTEGIGHTEFKETELGRIPKEWEVRKLENCANFVSNGFVGTASPYYSEDKEDNYYLMGNNVRENYIDKRTLVRISKEFVQKYPKTKVYEYDMLTVQSGHIGTSCIITKEFDGANCHAVIITRFIKDLIDPNFQAYYLNSSIGKRRLKSIFVGTTIKHINTKDLKTFLLAVPLLSEQQKIASILSSIDERIDLYKSEKEDFMQVKKGLMEKLLTGKIRV